MDWHHFIDLPSGQTPGKWEQPHLEAALPMLAISKGEAALDIGCLDGRWSFALEALGASVTAIDIVSRETFRQAHQELGSNELHRVGRIVGEYHCFRDGETVDSWLSLLRSRGFAATAERGGKWGLFWADRQ